MSGSIIDFFDICIFNEILVFKVEIVKWVWKYCLFEKIIEVERLKDFEIKYDVFESKLNINLDMMLFCLVDSDDSDLEGSGLKICMESILFFYIFC